MFSFAGDSRFFWPQNIINFIHLPSTWDSILNTGIGMPDSGTLWITSYLNFTSWFTKFGLSWNMVTLLFWILPIFVVSFLGAYFLFRHFFKHNAYAVIAGIIYSFNTYILLIVSGGQFGVGLAYSFAPFVFLAYAGFFEEQSLKSCVIAGLVLGLQILFDPRLVVLTLICVLFYFLFRIKKIQKNLSFFIKGIVSFVIPVFLNFFWILPTVLFRTPSVPTGFGNTQSVTFFSFADFSHTLSFLHPNWPENIFGKVYFMQPEFILLPILAFASLLFISKKEKESESVLFFILLLLFGAFLAKGTNPPFGQVYLWLFTHVPGFIAFRDPTKWYLLLAIAYSMLIPFSLLHIDLYLQNRFKALKKSWVKIVFIFSVILFGLLLRQTITSKNWQQVRVPGDYIRLRDYLYSQKDFSRTLWIPQWQRFGFFSLQHPAVGRSELFGEGASASAMLSKLQNPDMQSLLRDLSVKYVIVPFDSQGEIFLADRKYDDTLYLQTVHAIAQIPFFSQERQFGKIALFSIPSPKDHFWIIAEKLDGNTSIIYSQLSETKYNVSVQNATAGDSLVFSEMYDPNWVAKDLSSGSILNHSAYRRLLNKFVLDKDGNYTIEITYKPQRWLMYGLYVSGFMFIAILIFLLSKKSYGKK